MLCFASNVTDGEESDVAGSWASDPRGSPLAISDSEHCLFFFCLVQMIASPNYPHKGSNNLQRLFSYYAGPWPMSMQNDGSYFVIGDETVTLFLHRIRPRPQRQQRTAQHPDG